MFIRKPEVFYDVNPVVLYVVILTLLVVMTPLKHISQSL